MKTGWALGAAFVALVLVLIVFAVMATEMGSADRLSSTERLEEIDVPTIGTVGDFPDPAHRVVVNVTADGTIVVAGTKYTMPALLDELKRRGGLVRGELLPGTHPPKYLSDLRAVLRIDGRLPWGGAQRLIMACSEAVVWRISFAVRHEGDGEEGALGFPLPKDKGCEDPNDRAWKEVVVTGSGDRRPETLHAELRQSPASLSGKLGVRLSIDPSLSTATALRLVDAAIRVGAVDVDLACLPVAHLGEQFTVELARWRVPAARGTITLDGKPLTDVAATADMPAIARVHMERAVTGLKFSSLAAPTDELGSPPPRAPSPK